MRSCARALREAGQDCLHVRLDDWIMPAAERRPHDTGEIRNRADRLPAIIAALRAGTSITAPGYDGAKRTQGPPVTYAPAGHRLILVEGVFAAHPSVRPMIDIAAFVDVREGVQRARFDALYRWKGLTMPLLRTCGAPESRTNGQPSMRSVSIAT